MNNMEGPIISMYAERIDAHVDSDFSHAIENAKALPETIFRQRATN
ncbi:MAG: hypothetical protein NUV86_04715 [Candidatus Scalindua sp.]|nr:hypothetical protein [Candidatus Scalindua sp.]MCR4345023.1 hypothetical protein [Candidatus Scalindua sp.]